METLAKNFLGTALSIRRGNLGSVATPSQIASAHRKIEPKTLHMQEAVLLTREVRRTASIHKKVSLVKWGNSEHSWTTIFYGDNLGSFNLFDIFS